MGAMGDVRLPTSSNSSVGLMLRRVGVYHSLICMRSIESVAALMRIHPRLQEVRLVDSQLVGGSFRHFCQGLEKSRTVKRLHLVNVEVQQEDAAQIAALISQDACCLDELILSENDLGDKGVATLIQDGVLQNHSLRVLDLRSNGVTAEGALSLQGLLVSSRNIVSLQLGNNELGDQGVSALARGLQARTRGAVLQVLDLTNNGLTSRSCVSIASMLKVNKNLINLNLSFNKIGDDGARTLGLAMECNTTLRWLSLRRNGISNAGAKAIARMLPNMNGLKELILVKNDITHVGAIALLNGLRENVELEYLHVVDDTAISQPVAREIIHWIRLNKAGRRIFRQPNEVHPSLWPLIYERVSAESDMLYYFLSENPDVLLGASKC
jgi:NLR family CARD domain-containing protein 3